MPNPRIKPKLDSNKGILQASQLLPEQTKPATPALADSMRKLIPQQHSHQTAIVSTMSTLPKLLPIVHGTSTHMPQYA